MLSGRAGLWRHAVSGVMTASMVMFAASALGNPPGQDDATQDYLTAPNFPARDQLPTEAAPELADGLTLAPGAVSKAAMVFTPGGSTGTRAKLDAQVYENPIFGNQTVTTGADGIEGDAASSFTRARRYRPGSRFDLLRFTPDGLDLDTVCSLNNSQAGCMPGHVYGALIRLPTVILPGDIVSITMRTGNSRFFYTGPALYAAVQTTPGAGGRPYEGRGGVHYAACYGEIDINDDYAVSGIPVGRQLKMGALANGSYAANRAGRCFRHAEHQVYDAEGAHFAYHSNDGHPYAEARQIATYAGFHTYTMWITADGSNLIHFFVDGLRVSTQYYEPGLSTYADRDGHEHPIGYSLVIAAQTIPTFLNPTHDPARPPYVHIVPQDGGPVVAGPWSATIRAIRIIHGAITAKAMALATVDRNGTDGVRYGHLPDYP